jgi:hypothetical protein
MKNEKLKEANKAYEAVTKEYAADIDKIKERVDEIVGYIDALNVDKTEIVNITPGDNGNTVNAALTKAKADRDASAKSDNEAILSMGNQTRSVAYCPIY